MLDTAVQNDLTKWIAFTRPDPTARLRLFCFAHAGGGASLYRGWLKLLPPEVDVCPVQLPGRESRVMEEPICDMPSLLDSLFQALHPALDKPFAFFGHSMGALVAFELCRHLRRHGKPLPQHLFVSGLQAPPRPGKLPPMSHLPDDEFAKELHRLNYTPDAVFQHKELLEMLLPALKADFTLFENYSYTEEPALDCPISAFGGERDNIVFEDDIAAWDTHTTESFMMRMFPGDHFYLNHFSGQIAEALTEDLELI